MYMYIKCREKELEGYLANWKEGSAVGGMEAGREGLECSEALSCYYPYTSIIYIVQTFF